LQFLSSSRDENVKCALRNQTTFGKMKVIQGVRGSNSLKSTLFDVPRLSHF